MRLGVDDVGEGLAYLIDLAGLQLVFCPCIEVEDGLARVLLAIAGRAVGPERTAVVERKRNANQLGVEPCGTTLFERVDCALWAAAGGEDIEMLRDGADAGQ